MNYSITRAQALGLKLPLIGLGRRVLAKGRFFHAASAQGDCRAIAKAAFLLMALLSPVTFAQTAAPDPNRAASISAKPAVAGPQPVDVDKLPIANTPTDCFWLGVLSADEPNYNINFPDSHVTYWISQVRLPKDAHIELSGRFPYGRHMSFNTYNSIGEPIDRVNDVMIEAQSGATNPYRPGALRNLALRDYRVNVSPLPPQGDAKRQGNTLYGGSDDSLVQIYYRVYVPDRGRDVKGGVDLPKAEVVFSDGRRLSGQTMCNEHVVRAGAVRDIKLSAPAYIASNYLPGYPKGYSALNPPAWEVFINRQVSATRVWVGTPRETERQSLPMIKRGGYYSTLDNDYIAAPVHRRHGEILVLKGQAPRTPATTGGNEIMQGGDLRYWSICQNVSSAKTAVIGCLYDEMVPLDTTGHYTVLISRKADRPDNARIECGVAWMDWGNAGDGVGDPDAGLLIMRHLLADPAFPGAIGKIPRIGQEKSVMGPVYPQGQYTQKAAFEKLGCPVGL